MVQTPLLDPRLEVLQAKEIQAKMESFQIKKIILERHL
jgi:hypothetical protein